MLEVLLDLDKDMDPLNRMDNDPNDAGVVYVPPTGHGLRDYLVDHILAQL